MELKRFDVAFNSTPHASLQLKLTNSKENLDTIIIFVVLHSGAVLLVGENRENSYPCIKHASIFTNLILWFTIGQLHEDLEVNSVKCIIQFLSLGEAAEALQSKL